MIEQQIKEAIEKAATHKAVGPLHYNRFIEGAYFILPLLIKALQQRNRAIYCYHGTLNEEHDKDISDNNQELLKLLGEL